MKAGKNLQDPKVFDGSLTLVASNEQYQRFLDYTIDNKIDDSSNNQLVEYEGNQDHQITRKEIKNPRKEELLAKKKKADDETVEFMKNVVKEKSIARAQTIKEAKNLLLQKTPLCRGINRALFQSECLRELGVQLDFQKTLKTIDKDIENDYAERLKVEVERYQAAEKEKSLEKLRKNQQHGIELKKQIDAELSMKDKMNRMQFEMEQREQEELKTQLQTDKELEIKKSMEKKRELQESFNKAREQAKRHEEELKHNTDLDDRITLVYRKAKDRIRKMHKSIEEKSRKERLETSALLAQKVASVVQSKETEENAILQKVIEQRETVEKQKIQAKKNYQEKLQSDMEKYRREFALERENREKQTKELSLTEAKRRFEKLEFDQKYEETEKQLAKQKKQEYASALRDQIEKQKAIRQDDQQIDNILQEEIHRTNQQILKYAQEVLEESKDIRPVYPIYKAIKECKKDMGLTHQRKTEPKSMEKSVNL